jgi:hypothetical protein
VISSLKLESYHHNLGEKLEDTEREWNQQPLKKKSYHRNKKFVNVSKNELKSKIGHETPSFGTSCPMASRFFSKSRNRSHVHHSHFYNIYTCGEYGHQYMRGSA